MGRPAGRSPCVKTRGAANCRCRKLSAIGCDIDSAIPGGWRTVAASNWEEVRSDMLAMNKVEVFVCAGSISVFVGEAIEQVATVVEQR